MMTINIYLTFDDDCEEAFTFYKSVFKKEFDNLSRFDQMPPQDGMPPITDAEKNKVMHVTLPISKETVLMGSDTGGEWGANFKQGNNFSISINLESKVEADRIFSELSEDGQINMPMANTFWGAYFGMFTDKFGINWMINVNLNDK